MEKVLKPKNELRKLNITNIDLPQGSMGRKPKFVLVLYYRLLWSSSIKLYGKDKIFGWYVLNGPIKIKVQETSPSVYVAHMEVFREYFPVNKYNCTVCKYSTGCFVELFLPNLLLHFLIYFFAKFHALFSFVSLFESTITIRYPNKLFFLLYCKYHSGY